MWVILFCHEGHEEHEFLTAENAENAEVFVDRITGLREIF
jgi:hypothetical protein